MLIYYKLKFSVTLDSSNGALIPPGLRLPFPLKVSSQAPLQTPGSFQHNMNSTARLYSILVSYSANWGIFNHGKLLVMMPNHRPNLGPSWENWDYSHPVDVLIPVFAC